MDENVSKQEELNTVSIPEQGARLREPFTMIDLARIDELMLSVYLCQGAMAQHRHLDQDELFLVHSGAISLDSEWETIVLRAGELTVVPKGVGHRSASLLRSRVLLFQPRLMVHRRNGDRRLMAFRDEEHLEKVSVPAMGRQLSIPFSPVTLAHVDVFTLTLTLCRGTGPWQRLDHQASLVFCYAGNLFVETDEKWAVLDAGELTVIPPGVPYRLSSRRRALVLGVRRPPPPALTD